MLDNNHPFLILFFEKLEVLLNQDEVLTDLKGLSLHTDEANIDRPLKMCLKKYINENIQAINEVLIGSVVINNQRFDFDNSNSFKLKNAALDEEISSEEKIQLRKEGVKSTCVDIALKFIDKEQCEYLLPVELKSTKTNSLPGSSIQQVEGYEWCIFLKQNTKSNKVITGQYYWLLSGSIPFPDRSPRPVVGHSHGERFKENYISKDKDAIFVEIPEDVEQRHVSMLRDWKTSLSDRWVDDTLNQRDRSWFQETMLIYSHKLLEYFNTLSDEERKTLLDSIKDKI